MFIKWLTAGPFVLSLPEIIRRSAVNVRAKAAAQARATAIAIRKKTGRKSGS
jgi:hypothetical protein